MMNELFPVLAGLLLGLLMARFPSRRNIIVLCALAVLCGVTATLISGEYRLSWVYAVFDIAQAVGAEFAGFILMRLLRHKGIAS
jgi:hypothetical protein